jgi:inner membrane protein
MDPITHALSGALLASVFRRRARASAGPRNTAGAPTPLPHWKWVLVLTVAAMSPDIDILLEQLSIVATLTDRRGITHSLLGLPVLAIFVGGLLALVLGERRRVRGFIGLAALGIALHIAFDLINAFGVMLLAPLSFRRFDLGITFIVDLWLALLLLAGLIASSIWKRTRVPALVAWGVVLTYFAVMFWAKSVAEHFGRASATTLFPQTAAPRVTVYPRPLSPFNWTVLVRTPAEYQLTHVNVVSDKVIELKPDAGFINRVRSAFTPLEKATWRPVATFGDTASLAAVERVWAHADFAFFRDFADAPAFMKAESNSFGDCVFFEDLRFRSPGRETHPFRYGMCFKPEGGKVFRFTDDGNHTLVPHPRRLLFSGN